MPTPRKPSATTIPAASKQSAALDVGAGKRGNYRQYTDAEKAEALVALKANGGNVKGMSKI